MLKYTVFLPRFQLIRRRQANRPGQDEVFGRNITIPESQGKGVDCVSAR